MVTRQHTHKFVEGEAIHIASPLTPLAALAWGDRDAPPALALHGWLDNAMTFAGIGPLLHDTRLIALDLPGHGHSAHRPPGVRYHFIDYIADVRVAADTLGLSRFTLIGHSLGAAVATITAAVLGERVERLVLIEGLGPLARSAEQSVDTHIKSIESISDVWRPRQLRQFSSIDTAVRARVMAGEIDEASARVIVQRNLKAVAPDVQGDDAAGPPTSAYVWRTDPRLRLPSPIYFTEEQVHAHLARISAPTLAIVAEPKPGALVDKLAVRAAKVSALQIVHLTGAHHLHLDTPAPVADAINEFLTHYDPTQREN